MIITITSQKNRSRRLRSNLYQSQIFEISDNPTLIVTFQQKLPAIYLGPFFVIFPLAKMIWCFNFDERFCDTGSTLSFLSHQLRRCKIFSSVMKVNTSLLAMYLVTVTASSAPQLKALSFLLRIKMKLCKELCSGLSNILKHPLSDECKFAMSFYNDSDKSNLYSIESYLKRRNLRRVDSTTEI